MKKKIILTVLIMFLFCTLASPITAAQEKSEQTLALGIFTPAISFELDKNLTDEPIDPLQNQEVDIKVKFKLDMSPIAKWIFFKRRIGRLFLFGLSYILKIKPLPISNLNITISESPTWCSAKIDTNVFEFSFDDIYNSDDSSVEKTVKLEYMVDENATALEKDDIKIQAEFSGLHGINANTNSTTISVTVAYVPDILVQLQSELFIPPIKNTTIPINVTNNGNGESIISIAFASPENWTTILDQNDFNLKVNQTKQITLTVYPTEDFTNQTINFSFTPKSIAGEYEGTAVISSIIFVNDGSLEEEGELDIVIIGIIILVIVILILLVLFLFFKKKKQ